MPRSPDTVPPPSSPANTPPRGGNYSLTPTAPGSGRSGHTGHFGRFKTGGLIDELCNYLRDYIVLPPSPVVVTAAWIVASHMYREWERFPHLGVFSPEKRCGKTKFLQLMQPVLFNCRNVSDISGAAIYRLITNARISLLIDEAQKFKRGGSESSLQVGELLKSSIDRDSMTVKCVGQNHEVKEFSLYCPKVIACIGGVEEVLADRCLPIGIERKADEDDVRPCYSRDFKPVGHALNDKIQKWAEANTTTASHIYKEIRPFKIKNDRMAELMLPLQATLATDWLVDGGPTGDERALASLQEYAFENDYKEAAPEKQSIGVQLLVACKEIFEKGYGFLPTGTLIAELLQRTEEPWGEYRHDRAITAHALSRLLREYEIFSQHSQTKAERGYSESQFREAWTRYLPASKQPPKASQASEASRPGQTGGAK